jgi:hypothetical protein
MVMHQSSAKIKPVVIPITADMLHEAHALMPRVAVVRTKASPIDNLAGVLGEMTFAQYWLGDWRSHRVGRNKGQPDFPDIEVKASAHLYHERLHLLVREDYALKRKPRFYVQVVINVAEPHVTNVAPDTAALVCGFATTQEVDAAPLRDFGSKYGGDGGYRCRHIVLTQLHPIEQLRAAYQDGSSPLSAPSPMRR